MPKLSIGADVSCDADFNIISDLETLAQKVDLSPGLSAELYARGRGQQDSTQTSILSIVEGFQGHALAPDQYVALLLDTYREHYFDHSADAVLRILSEDRSWLDSDVTAVAQLLTEEYDERKGLNPNPRRRLETSSAVPKSILTMALSSNPIRRRIFHALVRSLTPQRFQSVAVELNSYGIDTSKQAWCALVQGRTPDWSVSEWNLVGKNAGLEAITTGFILRKADGDRSMVQEIVAEVSAASLFSALIRWPDRPARDRTIAALPESLSQRFERFAELTQAREEPRVVQEFKVEALAFESGRGHRDQGELTSLASAEAALMSTEWYCAGASWITKRRLATAAIFDEAGWQRDWRKHNDAIARDTFKALVQEFAQSEESIPSLKYKLLQFATVFAPSTAAPQAHQLLLMLEEDPILQALIDEGRVGPEVVWTRDQALEFLYSAFSSDPTQRQYARSLLLYLPESLQQPLVQALEKELIDMQPNAEIEPQKQVNLGCAIASFASGGTHSDLLAFEFPASLPDGLAPAFLELIQAYPSQDYQTLTRAVQGLSRVRASVVNRSRWMIMLLDSADLSVRRLARTELELIILSRKIDLSPMLQDVFTQRDHPGFSEVVSLLTLQHSLNPKHFYSFLNELSKADEVKQYAALCAVADLRPEQNAELLDGMLPMIRSESVFLRRVAYTVIAAQHQKPEQSLPILIAGLEYNDEWIRLASIRGIASFEDQASFRIEDLTNLATRGKFIETRLAAIVTLGKLGVNAPEAVPTLLNLMQNDQVLSIRIAAALALNRIPHMGTEDSEKQRTALLKLMDELLYRIPSKFNNFEKGSFRSLDLPSFFDFAH